MITSSVCSLGCARMPQSWLRKLRAYPDRPIRLIVPFAAGGTVDIVARIVGAKLAGIAAAKVVVDNRGGAGGVIGTEMVAQAQGDG